MMNNASQVIPDVEGLKTFKFQVNTTVSQAKSLIILPYYIYIWTFRIVRPGSTGTIEFLDAYFLPASSEIFNEVGSTATLLFENAFNTGNTFLNFNTPIKTKMIKVGNNGIATGLVTFEIYYTFGTRQTFAKEFFT